MEEVNKTEHKHKDSPRVNTTLTIVFVFLITAALGFYGGRWYERFRVRSNFLTNGGINRNMRNNTDRLDRGFKQRNGATSSLQKQEQPSSPSPTTESVPQGQPTKT